MTAPAADEIEAIRARWSGDGPQAWRSGAEARDVRTLLAALDTARAEAQSERELAVAHAAYAQVYRARAETARREAIEEAIAACERKRKEYARLATKDGYSHCHDRADGARECVGELRALLDGPAREGRET